MAPRKAKNAVAVKNFEIQPTPKDKPEVTPTKRGRPPKLQGSQNNLAKQPPSTKSAAGQSTMSIPRRRLLRQPPISEARIATIFSQIIDKFVKTLNSVEKRDNERARKTKKALRRLKQSDKLNVTTKSGCYSGGNEIGNIFDSNLGIINSVNISVTNSPVAKRIKQEIVFDNLHFEQSNKGLNKGLDTSTDSDHFKHEIQEDINFEDDFQPCIVNTYSCTPILVNLVPTVTPECLSGQDLPVDSVSCGIYLENNKNVGRNGAATAISTDQGNPEPGQNCGTNLLDIPLPPTPATPNFHSYNYNKDIDQIHDNITHMNALGWSVFQNNSYEQPIPNQCQDEPSEENYAEMYSYGLYPEVQLGTHNQNQLNQELQLGPRVPVPPEFYENGPNCEPAPVSLVSHRNPKFHVQRQNNSEIPLWKKYRPKYLTNNRGLKHKPKPAGKRKKVCVQEPSTYCFIECPCCFRQFKDKNAARQHFAHCIREKN